MLASRWNRATAWPLRNQEACALDSDIWKPIHEARCVWSVRLVVRCNVMRLQTERISMTAAYPEIQHANQILQVAVIHFARDVYRRPFDAIDGTLEPFDIFHGAINTRKYSTKLYPATYRWSGKRTKYKTLEQYTGFLSWNWNSIFV